MAARVSSLQAMATRLPNAATLPGGTTSTGRSVLNRAAWNPRRVASSLPLLGRADHDEVSTAAFRAENGISEAFNRGPSSCEGRLLGSVHPAVVGGLELRNPLLLLLRQGVQQAAGQVCLGSERGVPRWCTDGEDIDASAAREHSETLGRM